MTLFPFPSLTVLTICRYSYPALDVLNCITVLQLSPWVSVDTPGWQGLDKWLSRFGQRSELPSPLQTSLTCVGSRQSAGHHGADQEKIKES